MKKRPEKTYKKHNFSQYKYNKPQFNCTHVPFLYDYQKIKPPLKHLATHKDIIKIIEIKLKFKKIKPLYKQFKKRYQT